MQRQLISLTSSYTRLFHYAVSITLLLVVLGIGNAAVAQSRADQWTEPLNLSRSGGTTEPDSVVDTAGRTHLIWRDVIGTFFYSFEQAGQWSEPTAVELPFGTRFYEAELNENQPTPLYSPVLRAGGPEDFIHAIWTDDEEALYHSRVSSGGFSTFTDWGVRQRLAEAALAMDMTVDDEGGLHMVYIRPVDSDLFPAGVYYRASQDDGLSWTAPVLLSESSYFRSLSAEDTNLVVLVPKPDEVYVAWDHSPLERLYFTRSADGGLSWDEAIIIDQREEVDRLDALGPVDIRIAASADTIHLVWLAGHGSRECGIYTQLSTDGGLTWLPRRQILEGIPNCVEDIALLNDPNDSLYLLAETEESVYLSAWDSLSWRAPLEQSQLATLTDPETFRPVALGCLQAHFTKSEDSSDTLSVIGCDKSGNGDIWLRSQGSASLSESIAPSFTPVWQPAEYILADQDLRSPLMLSDNDGQLHVFWSQGVMSDENAGISYSRWDGTNWSLPRIILRPSTDESISQFTIVFDGVDKILAAWNDEVPGAISFSQSRTSGAGSAADWSTPQQIPLERPAATSPALASDRDGVVYLAYTIPLNEDRGIYLTASADGGESWSEGQRVFDAVEAGWAMVDHPQIVVSPDGIIHLSWKRFSSPINPVSESVYYARSSDGGITWSEPVILVNNPTGWQQMSYDGERLLHFSWLAGDQSLWHRVSKDHGITWDQSQRVSVASDSIGPAAFAIDGAGRPHLVKVGAEASLESGDEVNDRGSLKHWIWIDNRWSPAESSPLENSDITGLSAAITTGGKLAVLFTVPTINPESGVGQNSAFFSSRALDIPAVTPTPIPTITSTPVPQPSFTPTPEPLPTPTIPFPTDIDDGEGLPLSIDSGNPLTGPLLGIIPAGLLVIIVFFIGARFLRGDRR